MTWITRAAGLAAAGLITGGLIVAGPASARAATTQLCQSQTAAVAGGTYTVQNNEWGSSAAECITTDGNADFTVANSAISNATNGAPGGYPSIYQGCHWGNCTSGGLSGNPIQASAITTGKVTTSWSTTQPGGSSAYDVAYDIWFNQTPTTSGQPNGTELMIWLNHNGPVQPFGSQVARVSGHRKVPIVPALVTGILAIVLLAINVGNQSAFLVITGIAIIMFYLAYLGVTGPMLVRRLRGDWPKPDHGPFFSLGRWGLPVNIAAVVYGALVAINIAWPRNAVYNSVGTPHWYFQWSPILFIGGVLIIGTLYYFLVQVKKSSEVLEEHRANIPELPGEHIPLGEAAP